MQLPAGGLLKRHPTLGFSWGEHLAHWGLRATAGYAARNRKTRATDWPGNLPCRTCYLFPLVDHAGLLSENCVEQEPMGVHGAKLYTNTVAGWHCGRRPRMLRSHPILELHLPWALRCLPDLSQSTYLDGVHALARYCTESFQQTSSRVARRASSRSSVDTHPLHRRRLPQGSSCFFCAAATGSWKNSSHPNASANVVNAIAAA